MLAEAGCSAHMIQSITGHKHLAEVETYTKAASQRRLAEMAMEHLSNRTEWLDKIAKENSKNNVLPGEVLNPPSAPFHKTNSEILFVPGGRFKNRLMGVLCAAEL
jgi:hypothetical protein